MEQETLLLNSGPLAGPQVIQVARGKLRVEISEHSVKLMANAREIVEEALHANSPTYGINTGFGALSTTSISHDKLSHLQMNIIRSHAAGVGEPLESEVVRGMMLLLTASLSRGHSGTRPIVAQTIAEMLNANVTPIIPSRGSVGASGDLAPLAHLALVLCGEGKAKLDEKEMPGKAAMAAAGITPIVPVEKEGLALLNGTHLMASIATIALGDIAVICEAAVIATAMSIDAAKATSEFLDDRIHAVRGQSGQRTVAASIREHLRGSTILTSHGEDDPRVQDPYSFRCSPQVLGAAIESIARITGTISAELGAVTDNPLVFAEDKEILSGGNFHGMPLAIALDELRIALCHIAGIADRRLEWILSARDIHNTLPHFMACDPGCESGLMIVQYTTAACCAELRTLSMPASVSNISTSAGIEDYNSMGATAGLLLRQSVNLCRSVIASELLVGCDALDHHRPLKSGDAVEHMHAKVREVVPERNCDRSPSEDIYAIEQLLR